MRGSSSTSPINQIYNSMFKKKVKKDQGVLLADQEHQPDAKADPAAEQVPATLTESQNLESQRLSSQVNNQLSLKNQQHKNPGAPQNDSVQMPTLDGPKRTRQADLSYQRDANQRLDNEPKRLQPDLYKPSKTKTGLTATTRDRKQDNQKQVHAAFNDIAHKAGANLIKDMNLQEDELEEETAKRRYMENVETTKLIKEGKLNSKMYRGMNAYANHKMTNNDIKNAQESYKKVMGPSRLNSTIKNTCRFDYVQNICKDWHDSGYCPFGNSCLYLHDRSNNKTGWELEKDFQQQERERWKRINNPELAKKEDREKILKTIQKYKPPQQCQGCHSKLNKPVQMQCGHIFCSSCGLKMVKCKVCSKRLSGIMNSAQEKIAKMKQNYDDMVLKLEQQQEQIHGKRRKFENVSSLDVFAD